VRGVPELHRDGKVEPGWSAAENRNLHACDLLFAFLRLVSRLRQIISSLKFHE
jgi:hypothetical protein